MPVSLNFGNYQNYQINESRVNRMMSSDRAEATHMGIWDKFKDLFRTEKKSDALNAQGESVNILLNFAECFEASIEYLLEVFTTHSSNLFLPSDARFA
jgi:hypothetical protein